MTPRQKQMLYVGAALIVVMAWTFYTADGPQTTAVLAGTVIAATGLGCYVRNDWRTFRCRKYWY